MIFKRILKLKDHSSFYFLVDTYRKSEESGACVEFLNLYLDVPSIWSS